MQTSMAEDEQPILDKVCLVWHSLFVYGCRFGDLGLKLSLTVDSQSGVRVLDFSRPHGTNWSRSKLALSRSGQPGPLLCSCTDEQYTRFAYDGPFDNV